MRPLICTTKGWKQLVQELSEQPHLPYVGAVAAIQQLQPVASGGMCQNMLDTCSIITFDTVYRNDDQHHLLFLNRIK
ncbi:hypothetical protein N9L68_03085 [bacterium]|nr:hypothetical protein [bacterium]